MQAGDIRTGLSLLPSPRPSGQQPSPAVSAEATPAAADVRLIHPTNRSCKWPPLQGVVLPHGYTAEVKARERVGSESAAIRLDTVASPAASCELQQLGTHFTHA